MKRCCWCFRWSSKSLSVINIIKMIGTKFIKSDGKTIPDIIKYKFWFLRIRIPLKPLLNKIRTMLCNLKIMWSELKAPVVKWSSIFWIVSQIINYSSQEVFLTFSNLYLFCLKCFVSTDNRDQWRSQCLNFHLNLFSVECQENLANLKIKIANQNPQLYVIK